MCHLVEDVAPSACGRNGEENIAVWQQLARCEALPSSAVSTGLYACSPKTGDGFDALFSCLHIARGRLPGVE